VLERQLHSALILVSIKNCFINSGVSHSVAMVTIDQVDPAKRSRRGKYRAGEDTFYDSHTGTNRYDS